MKIGDFAEIVSQRRISRRNHSYFDKMIFSKNRFINKSKMLKTETNNAIQGVLLKIAQLWLKLIKKMLRELF